MEGFCPVFFFLFLLNSFYLVSSLSTLDALFLAWGSGDVGLGVGFVYVRRGRRGGPRWVGMGMWNWDWDCACGYRVCGEETRNGQKKEKSMACRGLWCCACHGFAMRADAV